MPRLPRADSVLFVCSENAVRSPMAEAIAKKLCGTAVFVDSVGVRAGRIDPFVVETLAEIGIDSAGHVAKRLSDLMDTSFDLVVSLSPEAHHQALELTRTSAVEVEFWNLMDPTLIEGNRTTRLDAYRALRDALIERINARLCGRRPPDPSR